MIYCHFNNCVGISHRIFIKLSGARLCASKITLHSSCDNFWCDLILVHVDSGGLFIRLTIEVNIDYTSFVFVFAGWVFIGSLMQQVGDVRELSVSINICVSFIIQLMCEKLSRRRAYLL